MKEKIFCCSMLLCFMVMLTACQSGNTVYLESDTQDEAQEVNATEVDSLEASSQDLGSKESVCKPASCYVYICGCVAEPGVYEVTADARICDVVALAGGLLDEAALESLNQAEPVTDGQMIRVLSQDEFLTGVVTDQADTSAAQTDNSSTQTDTRVNLNTATEEELMQLAGIGASKAQSIIAYRVEQGGFKDVNELMNIPGIKDGVFSKIKDSIRVD